METKSLALQIRAKRSEMMVSELEEVALRLFDQRGFANVTVEEIASEARISTRTFYRYFAAKDDVLQLRIVRRSEALRRALSGRPADEAPLRSLRLVLEDEILSGRPGHPEALDRGRRGQSKCHEGRSRRYPVEDSSSNR